MSEMVTYPQVCSIVWDGETTIVPPAMGTPRPDQLQGSSLDRLVELAGRVCYDSLGSKRSRNSTDYHVHINEVGHHSTHEHGVINAAVSVPSEYENQLLWALLNRPGLYVRLEGQEARHVTYHLTFNLRTAREWFRAPCPIKPSQPFNRALGGELQAMAATLAPLACGDLYGQAETIRAAATTVPIVVMTARPASEYEQWVSLHLENISRGLSHELVRHGDWTAMSQRSTRFVPESESEWIPHPGIRRNKRLMELFNKAKEASVGVYTEIAKEIAKDMTGPAAPFAIKQSRGAARGVLGNALETQFIFSAALAQWKYMIRARACDAADAEIRVAFCQIYNVLRERFPDSFAGWSEQPATDGLGNVVVAPPLKHEPPIYGGEQLHPVIA